MIDAADGGVIAAAGGCACRNRPPQNKSADATKLTIRVEEIFFMVIGDRVALRKLNGRAIGAKREGRHAFQGENRRATPDDYAAMDQSSQAFSRW